MHRCDVLIVGAGPAGAAVAWGLRNSGLDVTILEKARFPRDKVCGGWITPAVLDDLQISPAEYSNGRTLQPITAFRTSIVEGPVVETHYGRPVSYGIRRCEFDHYLALRSRAHIQEDSPLTRLDRSPGGWVANGVVLAPMVVGAGGHFCPVARFVGSRSAHETVVAAQEIEFRMDAGQRSSCPVSSEVPELYFCADLRGYGWCFRKGDYLNVGLGRMDRSRLPLHVEAFLDFLRRAGRIPPRTPARLPGHAYLLFGRQRRVVGDRFMLVGDAAGTAYPQSGEGIRTAIESGLLAARVILQARGDYRLDRLKEYSGLLEQRFGHSNGDWAGRLSAHLPSGAREKIVRTLMASSWFSRNILLDRWFLHAHQSPL
jgi:geranylgeranyl reductase family protein